jgi:hypothetical protein
MRVISHPEFPKDIRRFAADYATISDGFAARFRQEIDEAVDAIKAAPGGAGHFLNLAFNFNEALFAKLCDRARKCFAQRTEFGRQDAFGHGQFNGHRLIIR